MASESQPPFIKRFKTSREWYVYDVNTNRILSVDGPVYDILGDYGRLTLAEIRQKHTARYGEPAVEKALAEIEAARASESLFLLDRPQALSIGLSQEEWQQACETQLGYVILELTERCNLRCHYCTPSHMQPNAATQERRRMSVQTAFKAIDFFHAHSSQVEYPALGFYGGEPLLEFDLMRQCVDYARAKFGDDRIRFSLTTNGIAIDEIRAKYLAEQDFGVLASIDGPRRIHDTHRVDVAGNGSYERAVSGLRILHAAFYSAYGADAKDKIGINMVVTPPYDFDVLHDLWQEQPWLPKDIRTNVSYVDATWTDFFKEYPWKGPWEIHRRSRQRSLRAFRSSCLHKESPCSPVVKALFEPLLLRIYKRPIFQTARDVYHANGCCVLGVKKFFVTSDGAFRMCERAHGSPVLGSADAGYDFQAMWKVVTDYLTESLRDCRSCWAVDLCGLCFARAYRDGRFDREFKRESCHTMRKAIASRMRTYCSILRQDRRALSYMDEIRAV